MQQVPITLPTGDSAPFKGQVLQKLTQAKCSIVISHEQLCSFLWFHQQETVTTIACFVAGIYLLRFHTDIVDFFELDRKP